jgi:Domain of unknown function (DUF5122) beta-propeller
MLQPDGKIVIAGLCSTLDNRFVFCLARIHSDGALDTSFDGPSNSGNGTITLELDSGSFNIALAVALQPDGKIVVAGGCSSGNACVARLNGGPFGGRNCKLDFDGDGLVLPATDALLFARASLGFTGDAAVDGINFAQHATRNSWPLIRDYMISQCGMRLP